MKNLKINFKSLLLPDKLIHMKFIKLLLCTIILSQFNSFAQVTSDKVVGKNKSAEIDSIKNSTYPYLFPIWGDKVTKAGFKLPYPAGISVNYFWQKSELVINNLNVGFNGGPKYNLDEIVRFNETVSEASIINIRPDIWVLPFLNVYGILASAKPSTAVGFGVWVPDTNNNWREVFSYDTKAKFTAQSIGFGLTPTMGIGGGWIALDMNCTWTDVSSLDKPVFSYVIGPRFGKTFNFKKPERNVAVWVGAFRVSYSSATNGSINLNEVIQGDGSLSAKIDAGQQKVYETQQDLETWWNNLSSIQQENPVNKAKYEQGNRALTAAGNVLNQAEGAVNTVSNSTVDYSLDKKVKDKWNFIVGSQFQLNKHFMVRAEYGFLGSRQQFLTGIQYRFGL